MRYLVVSILLTLSTPAYSQTNIADHMEWPAGWDTVLHLRINEHDCMKKGNITSQGKYVPMRDCAMILNDEKLYFKWLSPGVFRTPQQFRELPDTAVVALALETRNNVYHINTTKEDLIDGGFSVCIPRNTPRNYLWFHVHSGSMSLSSVIKYIGHDGYGRRVFVPGDIRIIMPQDDDTTITYNIEGISLEGAEAKATYRGRDIIDCEVMIYGETGQTRIYYSFQEEQIVVWEDQYTYDTDLTAVHSEKDMHNIRSLQYYLDLKGKVDGTADTNRTDIFKELKQVVPFKLPKGR